VGEAMSSLKKMLSILDLFKEGQSTVSFEDIINELNVSIPTGYRYLKELCDAGLLAKVAGSGYIIGPKIIKLDRQISISDPIVAAGRKIMKDLVEATGCEIYLSNIYNDEILNVHSESSPNMEANISYSRGKPHPIYRGATSKIILAYLSKSRLTKIYHDYKEEITQSGLGSTWKEFQSKLVELKKQGYCITHGELDKGVSGIAAPVFYNDQIIGSLTLVLLTARIEVFNIEKLTQLVTEAAHQISIFE
jgi:DNA-binding IclR family transcriptional regulator